MSKMKLFFYWLSLLTFILLDVAIIVLTVWNVYPYKPLQVIKAPVVTNKNKVVRVGQQLSYTLSVCKYTDAPATIEKEFVDGVKYAMNPIVSHNLKGCFETSALTEVPNIPPGKYQMRLTFKYPVNPIRFVSVTTITDEFTVKEATNSAEFL